jgi:hemerythrin superfamily protein
MRIAQRNYGSGVARTNVSGLVRADRSGVVSVAERGPMLPGDVDAIDVLKADHRQVEEWFDAFGRERSADQKLNLARDICRVLEVHTTIEEELFHPAFLQATGNKRAHDDAELLHDNARRVIAEIGQYTPEDDEYYDSRVRVLGEIVKYHFKEEEARKGMFAKARASEMDLIALGKEISNRKEELMAEARASRGTVYRSLYHRLRRRIPI